MTLSRLTVRNFGGVEFFEAKLGQIALITGRNGSGKTSLLEAIKTIFEGGSDPSRIRAGADFALVEIEFSDGRVYEKKITPTDYVLSGRTIDGGIIKAPKRQLDEVAPALSFDPLAFLAAEPRKRAEFLLANMPLNFTAAEVNAACKQEVASGSVTLQKLNEIRQGRYDERTTINRQERDLEGTIQEMRRTLPNEEDKTDWAAERDGIAARYSEIQGEIEAASLKIAAAATSEKAGKRKEIEQKIAELKTELSDYLAEVDREAANALAVATRDLEAERVILAGRLGEAKERALTAARAAGVVGVIDAAKVRQRGHIMKGLALKEAIERLDALKAEKLRELSIDGFDLTYDSHKRPVITIHGIPLDNLNRQQQIVVAMQAVTQASGKLPLVLCECAELDDAHMAELTEGMRESGFQLITARWDNDGPLAIKDAA